MAGNIKGITIEFGGNTTKLDKALKDVNDKTRSIDKELRAVNNSLKFNPKNVELLSQKQALLTSKIDETKKKADALRQALSQMNANGVDKTSEEYRKLQRELITAESQQRTFNKQLAEVNNSLSPLGQLGTKFGDVGSKIQSISGQLKVVAGIATATATAIGALAVKAGATADDINTLSKVSGMSTSDLQLYSRAADLVDVSVSALAKSQQRMKKNMLTAAEGTGEAAEAFQALGVSVANSDGSLRKQDDVFQEVIKSLGTMENETERDAYAMAIFGKSATELNPLIEDMGRTYANVAQTFKDNNIAIADQETLDNANRFNDAIDMIKATVGQAVFVIGTKLAGTLAPMMEKLADKIGEVAGKIANMNPKLLAFVGGLATLVAGGASGALVIGKIATALGGILPKLTPLLNIISAHPLGIVITTLTTLLGLFVATGGNIEQLSATISEKITNIINTIVQMIPTIVQTVSTLIPKIIETLSVNLPQIIEGGVQILLALIQGIISAIPTLIQNIPAVVRAILSGLESIYSQLPSIGKNIIKGLWNGAQDMISWAVDKFKSLGKKILNAIKSALGIKSPSREFAKVGRFSVLGFVKGWEDNSGLIDSAMSSLVPDTNAMSASINAGFDYNSMYGAMQRAFADANFSIVLNDRVLGRGLREMGVSFNG